MQPGIIDDAKSHHGTVFDVLWLAKTCQNFPVFACASVRWMKGRAFRPGICITYFFVQTNTYPLRRRCGSFSRRSAALLGVILASSAMVLAEVSKRLPATRTATPPLQVVDVAPSGWRRTVDGWERAEQWFVPPSRSSHNIHQWLAIENTNQSAVVRALLEQFRSIHPLVYSASLLMAVLAIVVVNEQASRAGSRLPSQVNGDGDGSARRRGG